MNNGRRKKLGLPLERYWAIHERAVIEEVSTAIKRLDHSAIQARHTGQVADKIGFEQHGRVAVIPIVGLLLKYESFILDMIGGTSYATITSQIDQAASDQLIDVILLYIDSPGGSVAGLRDTADIIFKARSSKKVIASISDLGASAAYGLAAQAEIVYANSSAVVGSIGTVIVIEDTRKLYENLGIKAHRLATGDFKGAGSPGTVITDEHLVDFQRTIEQLGITFFRAVSRGRGWSMKRVLSVADGRVHVGQAAKALGLVDQIASYDDVLKLYVELADTEHERSLAPIRQADLFRRQTTAKIESLKHEIVAMAETATGEALTAKILQQMELENSLPPEGAALANDHETKR